MRRGNLADQSGEPFAMRPAAPADEQRRADLEDDARARGGIGQVSEAVLTVDLLYAEGPKGGHKAVVRNIQLDRITSTASPRVMFIRGFEGAVIENIRITNSTFQGVTETEVVSYARNISLDNVTIAPAKAAKSLNSIPPTK